MDNRKTLHLKAKAIRLIITDRECNPELCIGKFRAAEQNNVTPAKITGAFHARLVDRLYEIQPASTCKDFSVLAATGKSLMFAGLLTELP